MNVALRRGMDQDEFFRWAQAQDGRFEFDGFQPVAMTGGNLRHNAIALNIASQLRRRLLGTPCTSFVADAGVATVGDAVRYPDAVVTCSPVNGLAQLVPEPVVVFEVLSPSSVRQDRVVKLREYQAVPSIRRYVVIEPGVVTVSVLFRDGGTEPFRTAGLGAGDTLALPEVGIEIPLAEIYEGVVLDA